MPSEIWNPGCTSLAPSAQQNPYWNHTVSLAAGHNWTAGRVGVEVDAVQTKPTVVAVADWTASIAAYPADNLAVVDWHLDLVENAARPEPAVSTKARPGSEELSSIAQFPQKPAKQMVGLVQASGTGLSPTVLLLTSCLPSSRPASLASCTRSASWYLTNLIKHQILLASGLIRISPGLELTVPLSLRIVAFLSFVLRLVSWFPLWPSLKLVPPPPAHHGIA